MSFPTNLLRFSLGSNINQVSGLDHHEIFYVQVLWWGKQNFSFSSKLGAVYFTASRARPYSPGTGTSYTLPFQVPAKDETQQFLYVWMLEWTLPNSCSKLAEETGIQELWKTKLYYIWKGPFVCSVQRCSRGLHLNKGNAKLKQKKESVQLWQGCHKFVRCLLLLLIGLMLISIFMMTVACLICHSEMFAVGVRCVLFLSTREANSRF